MNPNQKKFISSLTKLFSSNRNWSPNQLDPLGQDKLSELQKHYEIPVELSYMYLGLRDQDDSIEMQSFNFISLSGAVSYAQKMREEGQVEYFDLATSYAGMGFYWVVSWLKDERKYFIRMDGGSNGYEAQENFERYVKKKIDWSKLSSVLLDWSSLSKILNGDESDLYCRMIGTNL